MDQAITNITAKLEGLITPALGLLAVVALIVFLLFLGQYLSSSNDVAKAAHLKAAGIVLIVLGVAFAASPLLLPWAKTLFS
jgi:phosphoglycerol transferase MdoB-like AlkP superfamily enzyme